MFIHDRCLERLREREHGILSTDRSEIKTSYFLFNTYLVSIPLFTIESTKLRNATNTLAEGAGECFGFLFDTYLLTLVNFLFSKLTPKFSSYFFTFSVPQCTATATKTPAGAPVRRRPLVSAPSSTITR